MTGSLVVVPLRPSGVSGSLVALLLVLTAAPAHAAKQPRVVVRSHHGHVVITGTAGDDAIVVTTRGTRVRVAADRRLKKVGRLPKIGKVRSIVVRGGAGNDSLALPQVVGPRLSTVTLDGGVGDDTYEVSGTGTATVVDPAGTDTLSFASRTTSVTMDLSSGAPQTTGPGTVLTLAGTFERVVGGSGNDVLTGGPGGDWLSGGPGADRLLGRGGDDRLDGGSGDDTYLFGTDDGTDTLLDTSGTDTVSFVGTTSPATLDLSVNTSQTPVIGTTFTLPSTVANVVGGSGDDVLTGNAAVNTFTGGPGADSFVSHGAGDAIDQVTDFSPADGDRLSLPSVEPSALDLGSGGTALKDELSGTFGFVVTPSPRSAGQVVTYGTAGSGTLVTYDGTGGYAAGTNAPVLVSSYVATGVTLAGAGGDDRIVDRSQGGNSLVGRNGHDILVGGLGNDTLQGDRGYSSGVSDTLTGGAGNDTFVFGEGFGGATLETFGNDTITDFGDGADTVDLASGLWVRSGLGTATVTVWDGTTDYGTIFARNGHLWAAGDFS